MHFQNFFNSIDKSVEKNTSNSFVNDFINNLIFYLSKSNNSIKQSPQNLFSIDRFEGNYAVCENMDTGELINISRSQISSLAKEGDILKLQNNVYELDSKITQNLKNEIQELLDKNKKIY